jgi:hypothetical protein
MLEAQPGESESEVQERIWNAVGWSGGVPKAIPVIVDASTLPWDETPGMAYMGYPPEKVEVEMESGFNESQLRRLAAGVGLEWDNRPKVKTEYSEMPEPDADAIRQEIIDGYSGATSIACAVLSNIETIFT